MNPVEPLTTLKDFQRDTVDYVLRRLYDDPSPTNRFLVADEVGMGKTLVARGVIFGAIERIQADKNVDRIDIIYICSNAEIARQNISKLNVRGNETKPLSTRITMLATQLRDLNRKMPDESKTVNLIAFTPGTSFDKGLQGGRVDERALIWWMLKDMVGESTSQRQWFERIMRLGVIDSTWDNELTKLKSAEGTLDLQITSLFRATVRQNGLLGELQNLIESMAGKRKFDDNADTRRRSLIGALRGSLAEVSIDALEPDLIILDEFQRFKQLLERPSDGASSEVSRLAHRLFEHQAAKVLLLSATPYKMYTLAEERERTGDDHYEDFISTIQFLQEPLRPDLARKLKRSLSDFRTCALTGDDASAAKDQVENALRQVMCRTERPVAGSADMLTIRDVNVPAPTKDDLLGFAALSRISKEVNGQLSVEYWKSAPYFLSFMDGYQLSRRFRERQSVSPVSAQLLRDAQYLTRADVEADDELDYGNSRLRALAQQTIDAGLWKLLWLPPSMPYYKSSGVYAEFDGKPVTKRLIFSSWAAAPSAIASLLSLEASRRLTGASQSTSDQARRLTYSAPEGRPAQMTALALFVPSPELARMTDPLDISRSAPTEMLSAEAIVDRASKKVTTAIDPGGDADPRLSRDTWYWATPFMIDGQPANLGLKERLSSEATGVDGVGVDAHLREADRAATRDILLGAQPDDLARWTGLIGLCAPANVAFRALSRTLAKMDWADESVLREAAATIGAGFHSLFNRPEVAALIDGHTNERVYWKAILEYCHAGNLQAVLDEYMHHRIRNESPTSPEKLVRLARSIGDAIALREAQIQAFDPTTPDEPVRMPNRFAVRYGTARGSLASTESGLARSGDVKEAFNSPFWPMVLASTSVGQEGVDFHWWCHAIVHWNLPSNPADFEQREGRVHRFKGHAVRKNVGAKHRLDAMTGCNADPWEDAFEAALAARPDGVNDIWPWWTYPGEAKIERWISSFPLSKDEARRESLSRQRALYRLAFGQPRQEDMVEVLDGDGLAADSSRIETLRIDLRPKLG